MKVEWAEPAVRDMESIRDYIRRDSEHYAARFVEKIVDAVENLRLFPMMGRCVPEAEEENIREILFYNYRIIYCVGNRAYYSVGRDTWFPRYKSKGTQTMGCCLI